MNRHGNPWQELYIQSELMSADYWKALAIASSFARKAPMRAFFEHGFGHGEGSGEHVAFATLHWLLMMVHPVRSSASCVMRMPSVVMRGACTAQLPSMLLCWEQQAVWLWAVVAEHDYKSKHGPHVLVV